eukprot:417397-Hanusia_phi.AAC.1
MIPLDILQSWPLKLTVLETQMVAGASAGTSGPIMYIKATSWKMEYAQRHAHVRHHDPCEIRSGHFLIH